MASEFLYLSEIMSYSHSIPCKKKSSPEGSHVVQKKGILFIVSGQNVLFFALYKMKKCQGIPKMALYFPYIS